MKTAKIVKNEKRDGYTLYVNNVSVSSYENLDCALAALSKLDLSVKRTVSKSPANVVKQTYSREY